MKTANNIVCDAICHIAESIEDRFPAYEEAIAIIASAIVVILYTLGIGWLFMYDQMLKADEDWMRSDSIVEFALIVMIILCFGALLEAAFLVVISAILAAFFAMCYYGWFIVLPLFLMFIGICAGKWLYVRSKRHAKQDEE